MIFNCLTIKSSLQNFKHMKALTCKRQQYLDGGTSQPAAIKVCVSSRNR